jgi:hypothetical protein
VTASSIVGPSTAPVFDTSATFVVAPVTFAVVGPSTAFVGPSIASSVFTFSAASVITPSAAAVVKTSTASFVAPPNDASFVVYSSASIPVLPKASSDEGPKTTLTASMISEKSVNLKADDKDNVNNAMLALALLVGFCLGGNDKFVGDSASAGWISLGRNIHAFADPRLLRGCRPGILVAT